MKVLQLEAVVTRRIASGLAISAALFVGAANAGAQQSVFVSDNSLSYSGGLVTTFGSLADAQGGTNALLTSAFPNRDLSLYLGMNASYYNGALPANFSYVLTNWFDVPGGSQSGVGNPSNTSVGFLQVGDDDGGSIGSMSGSWDGSKTAFAFNAAGSNTVFGCFDNPQQDCGRLWNGATSANGGVFLDWDISFNATFLTAATLNGASGLFESTARPTAITGQVQGLFHDQETDQYYRFQTDIGLNSYVYNEQGLATDVLYASNTVTPEPATMTLMATGLVGLFAASRRRRRRQLDRDGADPLT